MKIHFVLGILAATQFVYAANVFADYQEPMDYTQKAKQSEMIETRFHQLVSVDPRFQFSDLEGIRIEVAGGRAILSGTVDSDRQVKAAEELARKAGAIKVNNLMSSFEDYRRTAG